MFRGENRLELPEEKVRIILDLYTKLGYSIRKIAKAVGVSERQVKKVLYQAGVIQLPPNTCPRCFSKMIPDDQYEGMMYCKNCGYLKPRGKEITTLDLSTDELNQLRKQVIIRESLQEQLDDK